ncbi:hypothetical protein SCEN_N02000 [Saccharomyces cerevisiae]|nr:hypothetical protein SCEN_N02000 [Saccharomyces cerevisiae]
MSASIPETMKAVVIENGKAVVKQDIPIPELEEGFVLIKTVAVAGNSPIGNILISRLVLKVPS